MHKFLTLEGILLILGYLALAFLIVWFISLFKYKNDDETKRYFFLGFGFKMACCIGYAVIYDFYYGWAGDTYSLIGELATMALVVVRSVPLTT